MDDIDKKTKRKFLKELSKLTKKTGIAIRGCCGSPDLYKPKNTKDSCYTINQDNELLSWVKETNK